MVSDEELKLLRTQFNRPLFKTMLREELGEECFYCNSHENIEYHHVIPLFVGGDNRLNNILPICNACHKKIHFATRSGRRDKYKNFKHEGRPRIGKPQGIDEYLNDYVFGKIGLTDCAILLNTGRKKKTLRDYSWFPEYLESIGVKNFRNNVDILDKKGKLAKGNKVGWVEYLDGTREELFWFT